MDARARGVPVAQVLGEQGAVPRDKIVSAIVSTDVGRLATALDFDVRLPKRLLRELKIVVHAQTDTRLMIPTMRSEEHTSELHSLMRTSYAVFCLYTKLHRNTT